jgi:hypothetical protein
LVTGSAPVPIGSALPELAPVWLVGSCAGGVVLEPQAEITNIKPSMKLRSMRTTLQQPHLPARPCGCGCCTD